MMEDQNQMNNMMEAPKKEGSSGAIIGSIIIILVIVLGGFYVLKQGSGLNDMTADEIRNAEDQATIQLQNQGTSDEVSDIEVDLNGTKLNNLDSELKNINSELGL
jgi:hypothetical protein